MFLFFKIIAILFVLYLLYKMIILPLWLLAFYRRQGLGVTKYFLFTGFFNLFKMGSILHQNPYYYTIRFKSENPNAKSLIVNFIDRPYVMLSDKKLLEEFYGSKFKYYIKDHYFNGNYKRLIGTKNVFFSEDPYWKRRRQALNSVIDPTNYESIIQSNFDHLTQVYKGRDNLNIDLYVEVRINVAELITTLFLTNDDNLRFGKNSFGDEFYEILEYLGLQRNGAMYYILGPELISKGIFPSDRKINKRAQELRSRTFEEFKRRFQLLKEGKETKFLKTDFIRQYYTKGYLAEKATEKMLDIDEFLDEFMGFYMGGVITTQLTVCNVFIFLFQNPQWIQKLREEIDQIAFHEFTNKMILELPILNAIINETLRCDGPAVLQAAKVSTQDHYLGEFLIKKNTMMDGAMMLNHNDIEHYNDPLVFNPERWISGNAKMTLAKCPFALFPFLIGKRRCAGEPIGKIDIACHIIFFIKTFDMKPERINNIAYEIKFLKEPSQPYMVKLQKRVK